jgi:hypothetical protein
LACIVVSIVRIPVSAVVMLEVCAARAARPGQNQLSGRLLVPVRAWGWPAVAFDPATYYISTLVSAIFLVLLIC